MLLRSLAMKSPLSLIGLCELKKDVNRLRRNSVTFQKAFTQWRIDCVLCDFWWQQLLAPNSSMTITVPQSKSHMTATSISAEDFLSSTQLIVRVSKTGKFGFNWTACCSALTSCDFILWVYPNAGVHLMLMAYFERMITKVIIDFYTMKQ